MDTIADELEVADNWAWDGKFDIQKKEILAIWRIEVKGIDAIWTTEWPSSASKPSNSLNDLPKTLKWIWNHFFRNKLWWTSFPLIQIQLKSELNFAET